MDEEFTDYLNEDWPLENCPECGKFLYDIEFDMQYCDSCGWNEAHVKTTCPECGNDLCEFDFDYQICSRCGWDGSENE